MDHPSIALISKYFELNATQKEKYELLYDMYQEWNLKINIVSRKTFDQFYLIHVLHSLSIAKFINFRSDSVVLDLGTGGGFPMVPLSILFDQVTFIGVDSIQKKLGIIDDIAKQLSLTNIKTIHNRVEKLNLEVDFVVTRAVAPMSNIYAWSRKYISNLHFNDRPNGIIALKGGNLTTELEEFGRKSVIKEIKDYFDESFFETKCILYHSIK
ncbi:MAG: 16S rRNA (guanine(527)-N(7))-methyltransferase RsmG [Chitinophagales bacterium]|jgi:16S rRNA (guanine527-N7)-methyltransferase|nr:16S rRNA (guanine(527)-N(7))-methyltransferase RsmG [Chitinophagales bacterium]